MTDLRPLVAQATTREGLVRLLKDGLGWHVVDPEEAFEREPDIAEGVGGGSQVRVFSLIPSGVDDERLIVLAEFEREYVRRDLRELLRSLRKTIRETERFQAYTGLEDTVFIVAAPGYSDIRFVLFEERDRRLPRIRSFGWRQEFVGRTVLTHNLERLHWDARAEWEHAWDVEGLTEDFYQDYESVFAGVVARVEGAVSQKQAHEWTQLLFNRLLFLAFIQRMSWLQVPGMSRDGFLFDLHRADRGPFKTFLGVLRTVFEELDTKDGDPLKGRFSHVIGWVPYLNGGLFDKDDPLNLPGIDLPDDAFASIVGEPIGLFARYNFTVTESTPLDQEVAVDPEMLGKIFERIIIAEERHRSGTYYTPRPIVEFMVNEALKGYLVDRGLAPEKAALLVDEDKVESETVVFRQSEMQTTLDWLTEVRAVDPACGSGAYLLMLLLRLFELVDRLEVVRDKRRSENPHHLYETKLNLLQRCIYGVDISETAVRISRLRMWLSLVVENKGIKPEPLPNFDFLIMCGDSLASPIKPNQHALGYPEQAIREYTALKRRYFHPALGESRPTREAMRLKRHEISAAYESDLASSKLRSLSPKPFDWEIDFAEVFSSHEPPTTLGERLNLGLEAGRGGQGELAELTVRQPGFDIVLANPPYVNSGELLRSVGEDYKKALAAAYPDTGSGTADLLVFFMDRALQLLRPGGFLSFITSNKWLKAAYGKKLHAHLAGKAVVQALIDFGDLPVFQGTIAYPLITIAAKPGSAPYEDVKRSHLPRAASVQSLRPPYPDLLILFSLIGHELPPLSLGTDGLWALSTGQSANRIARMRGAGTSLAAYCKEQIVNGVKTGLNEAFLGPCASLPATTKVKALPGRGNEKWVIPDLDSCLLYVPWTVPLSELGDASAHLENYRQGP